MRLVFTSTLVLLFNILFNILPVFSNTNGDIKVYRLSDNTVVKISHKDLTCDNVTNGGVISGDEIGCPNPIFDPANITNVQLPTGGTGNLEYIWMYTTENPNKPFSTWTPIPNTNSPEYNPGPIVITTYFTRCSRRAGCTLYTGETNYVKKEIQCCPGNVTDGGIIGIDQKSCVKPFDPAELTNINSPSGGSGTIIYEWLSSPIGGSTNNGTWNVIPGATGASYNPPVLSQTTYYVRRAHVEFCNAWYYSNVLEILLTDGVKLNITNTNPTCFGLNNGKIELNVVSGQFPFTYKWSNGNINGPINPNLTAGNYSVTVTDSNGCTAIESIILIQPTELVVTGVTNPVICFGGLNGSVNITVSGGTPNYTYIWSSGETTKNISNKAAGTYSVTVTDANSCTSIKSFIIIDADEIKYSSNIIDTKCFGSQDGSISLTVTGGTPPYSYSWSNGASTNPLINTKAGTYSVTIQDSKGCKKIGVFTIKDAAEILVTANIGEINCFSGANGTISLTVSGGTSPFTYIWSNGANTKNLTNLIANMYSVTVTDANNCTTTKSFAVTQPQDISINANTKNPDCFNGTNGSIDLTVSGGTAPYSYNWNGAPGTNKLSNLNAGNYAVTVTDKNGCTKTAAFVISNPLEINIIGTPTNASCNKSNGAISITVVNGTAPFTYKWSNGATTKDLNNIAAGIYQVTVTDKNNCSKIKSFLLNDNGGINITETISQLKCFGDNNGSISISMTGGVTPYTIHWSTGINNSNIINNLSTGTYSVTVTDANQCNALKMFEITQPSQISINGSVNGVQCYGQSNGTISLTVIGGTSPYTYKWTNGATTKDLNNISANMYAVTVTDANNCTATKSFAVTQPQDISINANTKNPDCFNGTNGSIDLTVSGGTAPYSYNWNGAPGTNKLSNLGAGNYAVTVTDKNGCTKTAAFVISNPLEINITGTPTDASCNKSNGAISIAVVNGTAPFTYKWSNGATTKDLTNLAAGIYQVTVTDKNNCSKIKSFLVNDNGGINITETISQLKCFGDNNGSISISMTGGVTPYTIHWSTGINNSNIINNLITGTYSVTVTDANQCNALKMFEITQPSQISINGSVNGVQCYGQSNGTISLTVIGGTSPYTYKWTNGATTKDLNNISANMYAVTVTDANNCTATKSFAVTQPQDISINANTKNPDCFNGTNGSIDLTVSGGTAPYTYIWNGAPGTNKLSNLNAGNYAVTVTDKNGCTKTAAFVISNPLEINITGTLTDASCNKSNGAISITVVNGTAPFTYQWSNGATTKDLNNIAAGIYQVTVTDKNNCSKIKSFLVNDNGGINITETISQLKCFGDNNGSISISMTGGVTPYTIHWSNGVNNNNIINNLSAGTYSVTVTDANQCNAVKMFEITQPSQININGYINGVQCFGQSNGTISLTVSGGTSPYTYKWTNGATTKDLNNISANMYAVTVTDANNCTATKSFAVTQPQDISINANTKNPDCFNGTNGSIDLTVSGGTAPYTYIWNGAPGTNKLNNLSAGNYAVTVTDKNGCTKTTAFVVSNPLEINITGTLTDASCNKSNGAITITVVNGTAPFTYQWSNGATTKDLNNIAAGIYQVTVTDKNNCSKIKSFLVNDNGGINITETISQLKCFGDNNGSISISMTGGVTPYTIHWSNGVNNNNIINNLSAGTYSVTVTDANQCNAVKTFEITEPVQIDINGSGTATQCFGQSNGFISTTVSGGVSPYSYKWSNGALTKDLTNLAAGMYSVTVTDANSCTATKTFAVGQPLEISINANTKNPDCFNGTNGSIDLTVSGGTAPYTYIWNGAPGTNKLSNLNAGNYAVTVTDKNGCTKTAAFVVSNPLEINITGTPTDASCNKSNGGITITVVNGTAPFTYKWSNGATTKDLTNIAAGSYQVTVTDKNNCFKIKSFVVIENGGINISETITQNKCFGDKIGAISVIASGGVSPYSFIWSNGANSSSINKLVAGIYTVTVSDAVGCKAIKTYNINEAPQIISTITVDNITCNGANNGMLTINASGGTPSFTYKWSNGATTQKIQNLSAGNYSVTVTDANGCSAISTATIISPTVISLSAVAGKTNCYNSADATINLTVTGGTKPYSFKWSTGATTEDIANLAKGNYTVTVTDANGCTKIETYGIFSPIQINFDMVVTNQTCLDKKDGKISVENITGGTPPFTYKWNDIAGSTSKSISNLLPGTYTVTVTDSKNCKEVKSATILSSSLKCTVNIGDYVWLDDDKDGIQDDSEMGLNGIVVHLIDIGPDGILGTGDDVIIDTDYTKNHNGTKGYYYFPDVPAGKYVVMFFIDDQVYQFSPKNQGGNDAKDSNVNGSTGKTDIIMVMVGDQDNLTIDAGVYKYCDNIVNGGVICCDETLCSIGATPTLIQNVVYPSGGTGTIQYIWMKSTTNPVFHPSSPDWMEIPNSNAPSYQPGPLYETTYFIRCSRRDNCIFYAGESNMVTKTVVEGKSADILSPPSTVCKNELITLNSIDYGTDVSYTWTMGSGAIPVQATTPSTSVKWSFAGIKTIELAINYKGCISKDYAVISVTNCTNSMDIDYFTAVLNAKKMTDLSWRVNDFGDHIFEIERSQDNENFTRIYSMSGYPDANNSYAFTDIKPEVGMNYYRIKMYDYNAKYLYSDVKKIMLSDPDNRKVVVYPNPASDHITVEPLFTDLRAGTLEITDVLGRSLKFVNLEPGFKQFDIDVKDLVTGYYFINIRLDKKRPLNYVIFKTE